MRAHAIATALLFVLVLGAGCAAARHDPLLRGHYVWGAEVNTFAPCGSDEIYWVDAADTAQFRLERMHQELTTRPYEPVFVELAGRVGAVPARSRDGFPGDYDGMITLSWIGEMRATRPTDCQ